MTKSLKIIFPIAFIIITNLGSFCFQKLGQPFVFQIGTEILPIGSAISNRGRFITNRGAFTNRENVTNR